MDPIHAAFIQGLGDSHYGSPTKVSIGGVFLLGDGLPFRSGVVVSVRPLSVCHGS